MAFLYEAAHHQQSSKHMLLVAWNTSGVSFLTQYRTGIVDVSVWRAAMDHFRQGPLARCTFPLSRCRSETASVHHCIVAECGMEGLQICPVDHPASILKQGAP